MTIKLGGRAEGGLKPAGGETKPWANLSRWRSRGEKCNRLQNRGCRVPCEMQTCPAAPSLILQLHPTSYSPFPPSCGSIPHPMASSLHLTTPSLHPTTLSLVLWPYPSEGRDSRDWALPIAHFPMGSSHLVLRCVGKVRGSL